MRSVSTHLHATSLQVDIMITWILTASLIFGGIPLGIAMLGAAVLAHFQRRKRRG